METWLLSEAEIAELLKERDIYDRAPFLDSLMRRQVYAMAKAIGCTDEVAQQVVDGLEHYFGEVSGDQERPG